MPTPHHPRLHQSHPRLHQPHPPLRPRLPLRPLLSSNRRSLSSAEISPVARASASCASSHMAPHQYFHYPRLLLLHLHLLLNHLPFQPRAPPPPLLPTT